MTRMLSLSCMTWRPMSPLFFFNDTPTTEIYTLSLHDALPIYLRLRRMLHLGTHRAASVLLDRYVRRGVIPPSAHIPIKKKDPKSTRLNSSHVRISYSVFCLTSKSIKSTCLQHSRPQ